MSETVLRITGARLAYGRRVLWRDLDLDVHAGELIAVLGGNGTGKTSLLRAVLGLRNLTAGRIEHPGTAGAHPGRAIGYVPQRRLAEESLGVRGRDLVALGLDGHRWGFARPDRARRRRIDELLDAVGAADYADDPVAVLSGGELQRLRIAQALAGRPRLLLCDEPLDALDLGQQRAVSDLIDRQRREHRLGVLLVTHDINPVLGMVDRVLYLADGAFRVGTPDQVLTGETLSALYGTRVDVVRVGGRVVVVGGAEAVHAHPEIEEERP